MRAASARVGRPRAAADVAGLVTAAAADDATGRSAWPALAPGRSRWGALTGPAALPDPAPAAVPGPLLVSLDG